jgi:glycosyltransferase involved in cell wall biosynthesis
MAARNADTTVTQAISSILDQDTCAVELIFVDDASTDDTLHIARSIGDARVHVIPLARNVGRAAARNIAIERASAAYIAICDADDISMPHRFADQLDFLEAEKDIDLVSTPLIPFHTIPNPRADVWEIPTTVAEIAANLRRGRMPVAHPSATFRRGWFEHTGGYDPNMLWAEDFELVLRGFTGNNMRGLKAPSVYYRRPVQGTSWNYWRNNERWRRRALQSANHRGGFGTYPVLGAATDLVTFLLQKNRGKLRGPST